MALTLELRPGDALEIGDVAADRVTVRLVAKSGQRARLVVLAPAGVPIVRVPAAAVDKPQQALACFVPPMRQ
jgi:hypothetical protein